MFISIRKVFFNLKIAFAFLCAGIGLLTAQTYHISEHGDRLGALKNQHLLIEKIINTDLSDPKMASIIIQGAVAEIALSVKLSGEEALLDSLINSNEEQASLLRSLSISSEAFRQNALSWSESPESSRATERERMIHARTAYLADIDRMADYQIHLTNGSIATTKATSILLFILSVGIVFLFRSRLGQIYADIELVSSVDTGANPKEVKTREIDFVLKRLARRSSGSLNPSLIHPSSGLHNEKGMITAFNTKKTTKAGNPIFFSLFEIDHHDSLSASLSSSDIGMLYKKLGEIISLYEQPLDIIAQLEDNRYVFILSRSTKQIALEECENILHLTEASTFSTAQGPIRITLSAGFLHKLPSKSIEDTLEDGGVLIEKAKELGGNRISQIRD